MMADNPFRDISDEDTQELDQEDFASVCSGRLLESVQLESDRWSVTATEPGSFLNVQLVVHAPTESIEVRRRLNLFTYDRQKLSLQEHVFTKGERPVTVLEESSGEGPVWLWFMPSVVGITAWLFNRYRDRHIETAFSVMTTHETTGASMHLLSSQREKLIDDVLDAINKLVPDRVALPAVSAEERQVRNRFIVEDRY